MVKWSLRRVVFVALMKIHSLIISFLSFSSSGFIAQGWRVASLYPSFALGIA
jgi:hypothetical protein